jgi:hypothetical protein
LDEAVNQINPNALFFVAFFTLLGAVLGSWLIGALVGTGLMVIASMIRGAR